MSTTIFEGCYNINVNITSRCLGVTKHEQDPLFSFSPSTHLNKINLIKIDPKS